MALARFLKVAQVISLFPLDSLADAVGDGINQLAAQSFDVVQGFANIPFIGMELTDKLNPIVSSALEYLNEIGSARNYLEQRRFQVVSMVPPGALIRGNNAGDLLRLRYTHIHQSEPISLDAGGEKEFDAAGVAINFSLSGEVSSDGAQLNTDMTFGIDTSGPFVVEGSSLSANLDLLGSLNGTAKIGSLIGLTAHAMGTFNGSLGYTLTDCDQQQGEKLYLTSLDVFNDCPDQLQKSVTVSLDQLTLTVDNPAKSIPVLGDLFDAFTFEENAQFDLVEGTGTFEVTQVPKFGNIGQRIINRFLDQIDTYNPIPQNLRDLLTQPIVILGGQSLADPGADPDNSAKSADGDAFHLDLDFLQPASVINLLSAKTADLISMDITKTFEVSTTVTVIPDTPVMDEGKVLIVNLSKGRIGDDASPLLGSLLVNAIQIAAMSRSNVAEVHRRDWYLYVDEFQNFATESFATILSEARKNRLNLPIANQYLAQMDEHTAAAVFGNVGTLLCFQVGANDAEVLSVQLGGDVTPADLMRLPRYNAYARLLMDGHPSRPFSMRTIPTQLSKIDASRAEIIRRYSRQRYARPAGQVQAEIQAAFAGT